MTDRWPPGYRLVLRKEELDVPDPQAGFLRLTNGLLDWDLHRRAGLRVAAGTPRAAPGVEMASGVGLWRVRYYAPCRVIWASEAVLDDGGAPVHGQRSGFGYGTLPGHPESGEEGFYAELDGDGRLFFRIAAYSRPGSRLVRAANPVNVRVQRFYTNRYFAAAYGVASGS
ncbi:MULTISPECIES: DUF1990 domain-containing protein [unclassified Arthrobacter]|uniref:DUF1990 family protein n=1 Tax=unclassified Arthrobacter TaxID=235627 RepID=UPI001E5308DF|nr:MULTISPECIES: DUF1990 domain-containing protein [unclassified Arthrobacter]MCC9144083.1 DUF1990 domain-containing protein [Arthrobacter sp. zg-Y919]MDK1275308.1 DUF1990 domain-containing protein [Arthrobacter sp. zg.Y919]WIB03299.1 DUF1990 domain-containing protein [Arthrobacter sp. zg-Y919]